jgi:hypothetical protein
MRKILLLAGVLVGLHSQAQLNRPIKQHIDSSGIGSYKNTPKVVSDQEKNDYINYISGSRIGMDFTEGATFTINSVEKLFRLKEALDLLPTNRYFENNNPVLFGNGINDASPCDNASNNSYNSHKLEDKLSVNYNAQSSMSANYNAIFDVNIVTNKCNLTMEPVFTVNEGKQFGFGTNNPQATYHFTSGDLMVGNTNGYNFQINQLGNKFLQFANNGDILFLVDNAGKVYGKEFEVTLNIPVPDYVFSDNYNLLPIKEVENFISKYKHLPGVKSASEYEKVGVVNINELQMKLLEKIEELTLYTIQLQNQIIEQGKEIEKLKSTK